MKRMLIAALAAATMTLAGCATPAGYSSGRSPVDRIEAAYQIIRAPAARLAEQLPEPGRSRLRATLAAADAALAIVDGDTPMIDRVRAAEDLTRLVALLTAEILGQRESDQPPRPPELSEPSSAGSSRSSSLSRSGSLIIMPLLARHRA